MIDHLASSFLSGLGAADYQTGAEGSNAAVTAEMVDDVARKHFPPCMRNLYERLKRDHHLKHFGRLQLGLFLKVSVDGGDRKSGVKRMMTLVHRASGCRWTRRLYSGGKCMDQACRMTSLTKNTNTTFDMDMVKKANERIIPQRGEWPLNQLQLMLC